MIRTLISIHGVSVVCAGMACALLATAAALLSTSNARRWATVSVGFSVATSALLGFLVGR